MPMHQTDTLFHKAKAFTEFILGGEADNHAINTVPKETLVRIAKAEDGGIGGRSPWNPGTLGITPGNEGADLKAYIDGRLVERA
jgi:nitrate reductase alpha subunit